jgi:hypothetical protein
MNRVRISLFCSEYDVSKIKIPFVVVVVVDDVAVAVVVKSPSDAANLKRI